MTASSKCDPATSKFRGEPDGAKGLAPCLRSRTFPKLVVQGYTFTVPLQYGDLGVQNTREIWCRRRESNETRLLILRNLLQTYERKNRTTRCMPASYVQNHVQQNRLLRRCSSTQVLRRLLPRLAFYRLNVGRCTRSVGGTRSTGLPALRQAARPPTITNVLNPCCRSRCATRALVASRGQVQYR
jgi:hypothetical protein